MKNSFLLSIAAVVSTTSFILAVSGVPYSSVFYSVVPCVFLLLMAVSDYSPKTSSQRFARLTVNAEATSSSHRLRLAA